MKKRSLLSRSYTRNGLGYAEKSFENPMLSQKQIIYQSPVISPEVSPEKMILQKNPILPPPPQPGIKISPPPPDISIKPFNIPVLSQNKTIISHVIDPMNNPLPGAHIITDKAAKTITDANGKFKVEVPENAFVSISHIGYKTQTIQAKSFPAVVVMQPEATVLDGVTVTPKNPVISDKQNKVQKAAVNWFIALVITGFVISRARRNNKPVKATA